MVFSLYDCNSFLKLPVILGAARTPIGSFRSKLTTIPAPQLGAAAITGLLQRTNVKPTDVQGVLIDLILL